MMPITSETVLIVFLLFCRIGGCLMLMPGFSSTRVPMQVRLFVAVAVTLALTPLLLPTVNAAVPRPTPPVVLGLIFSETFIGALIGSIGRLFFMALQFMATAAAQFAGFSPLPGIPVEDAEPVPALATFFTLTATVLLFATEQHWEVLRALLASYTVLPLNEPIATELGLARLSDAFSSTFVLALQVSSPFIVYALVINLMVGIANKLVPQIPVYFIAMPLLVKFSVGFEQAGSDGAAEIALLPKVSEYLSLIMTLILGFGIMFQLPVVLTLLAQAGIIGAQNLRDFRRYAIVAITAAAGVLSPPDPFSMIAMALPTVLLYEAAILAVDRVEKGKLAREAAAQAEAGAS